MRMTQTICVPNFYYSVKSHFPMWRVNKKKKLPKTFWKPENVRLARKQALCVFLHFMPFYNIKNKQSINVLVTQTHFWICGKHKSASKFDSFHFFLFKIRNVFTTLWEIGFCFCLHSIFCVCILLLLFFSSNGNCR